MIVQYDVSVSSLKDEHVFRLVTSRKCGQKSQWVFGKTLATEFEFQQKPIYGNELPILVPWIGTNKEFSLRCVNQEGYFFHKINNCMTNEAEMWMWTDFLLLFIGHRY